MPVDFKTNQLKVNQIINSGSSAGKPLLIYGLGSSTDNSGGFNATHFITGSDVWLFISGTVGSRNSASRGAVAFGGDIIVSGVLYDSLGVAYSTSAGVSYFSSTTAGSIFTTGSVAFVKNEAIDSPLDKGSSVFFYVSGSDAGVGTSLFGGPVISSGSFKTKNASGDVVATMDNTGLISGSGLQSASGLTIAGDAAINGGNITSTSTTFNLLNTGVTTALNIGGAAVTTTIGSSSGLVIIPGDLYISGSTVTVGVENLIVEDPLIGIGFSTGSISVAAGDRGFIGGQPPPGMHVAFGWSQNSGSFIATKTTSSPGDGFFAVSDLQPIRARSFQVGGTTAIVTSSDGNNLTVGSNSTTTLSGSSVVLNADSAGFAIQRNGTQVGGLRINTGLSTFTVAGVDSSGVAKTLSLTGSAVIIGSNSATTDFAFAGTTLGVAAPISTTGFSIGSALGKNLTVSGSGDFQLLHSSTGLQLVQSTGTYLTFDKSNSNARLSAQVGLILSGTSVVLSGSAVNFVKDGTNIAYVGASTDASPLTGLFPNADVTYNLGSPALRWQNIYTGDLHLRNERGDYTLIEETDFLSIRFNKTGKRYKFLLERVPELDE